MLLEYIKVIKLTSQHEDFQDKEIESFQDLVDELFYLYIEPLGLPEVMNYTTETFSIGRLRKNDYQDFK